MVRCGIAVISSRNHNKGCNMQNERNFQPVSGWPMLVVALGLGATALGTFITGITQEQVLYLFIAVPAFLLFLLTVIGMTVLPPNQAGVFLLFGEYKGTARESGFWWVNPFYTKRKLSLRLHNLNGEKLKVNDSSGNPIDIAAVVVWRVEDTFAACFEVEDYIDFVKVQSDAALRHLASRYPYDSWEDRDGVVTLRGDIDVVSEALKAELQERLAKAGVDVQEARLSHLAYASEIAEAMLRRQQAHAIVAARTKIVEGAVGMVRMALEQISADGLIQMDEERKAAMVCNLLVVLCGETNAQPIVNAGTLYH
jgi:regulator of protease activity HflC (stomatin/prohibitin superfamily)